VINVKFEPGMPVRGAILLQFKSARSLGADFYVGSGATRICGSSPTVQSLARTGPYKSVRSV